ncbi:MFS transporter [Bacteroidales bacterium OttesenSCG-928-M11]|nr:MFS transporter [Bacteroidales bacterium OttesenSCG-928-M11]
MTKKQKNVWTWVPSLYFTEGLPYVAIVTMSVVMYKNFGMSNANIAFYTSWFYLPWVIKPLWSPFVDLIKTKRWWITNTQLLMGIGFIAIALSLSSSLYVILSVLFFWLLAFLSATHDIAADGFYLLGLNKEKQSFFIGIRNTFYRFALITGQGLLVYFAGRMEKQTGDISLSWSITFGILAGILLLLAIYHKIILPRPKEDKQGSINKARDIWQGFLETFASFFTKPQAGRAILFLLTYRFSEAQLLKLIQPFMLDTKEAGGLGLETADVGIIYGFFGVIGLLLGGILGGILGAKGGLKRWFWPMMLTMLFTSIVFVYLAYSQTNNWYIINLCILIEQFGYGFGFTAYTLFMMSFAQGKNKTAHYAICTGFMALGMMLPGMIAGQVQEWLGSYTAFFNYVMICSIIPIFTASLLKKTISSE